MAPALGTLTNKAYNALTSKFGNHAKAVAAGRAIAQQAGIEQPSDTLSLQMLKRWDDIKKVNIDEAKAMSAEDELGIELTKGQKTGDMGQLTREEMLRNSDSMAGRMIRGTDADNQRAIVDYFAKMRGGMAGGEAAATVGDAFDKVGQNVRSEFGNANRVTGELYEKVAQTGAMIEADAVREIPKVMKSAVAEFPITRDLTPGASSLISLVKKDVASLPDEATAVSLKAIETQRRRINQAIESASNPGDRRALMTLKNAFDGWFNKLDDAVVSGDPMAIPMMKDARAARASQGGPSVRSRCAGRPGRFRPPASARLALACGLGSCCRPLGLQFAEGLPGGFKRCRLPGEVLPAGDDDVAVFRVEFHHAAVPAILLASDKRGARAAEEVQDNASAIGRNQQFVLYQVNGLERGVVLTQFPAELQTFGVVHASDGVVPYRRAAEQKKVFDVGAMVAAKRDCVGLLPEQDVKVIPG
jgi:hypothetical protein